MAAAAEVIAATEAWFRSRGIPHFTEDYSVRRDVLTRGLPFLTFVLFLEVFLAINPAWPLWANVLVVIGGVALLAVAWAGSNVLQRRGLPDLPARVGGVQLLVFLLAPPALIVASRGDWVLGGWTVAANVGVLVLAYVTVSYALLPMLHWAGRRLIRDALDVVGLLARALPMLLIFVTFLFINAEVWLLAGSLEAALLAAVIGLFVLVTSMFLIFRLPAEIGALETFTDAAQVQALIEGTPVAGMAGAGQAIRLDAPLRRRQWANAGLVVLFTLSLQVLVVSTLVGGFFLVFGIIAMDEQVVASWISREPRTLDGSRLTVELLQVSLFLGAFSGFYFTISTMTNREYRTEFFEEVVGEVRQAFAVRAVYLGMLAGER